MIKGFQKNTLIDYPNKVACIVFYAGCNFHCPHCYNPSLVLKEQYSSLKGILHSDIINFINERKNWLDGVVLTGGEPLIHYSNVLALCQKIKKETDWKVSIKLDTNGSDPLALDSLLYSKLIDYVSLTIKSDKKNYHWFTNNPYITDNVNKSLKIIRKYLSKENYDITIVNIKGLFNVDTFKNIIKEFDLNKEDTIIMKQLRYNQTDILSFENLKKMTGKEKDFSFSKKEIKNMLMNFSLNEFNNIKFQYSDY